MKHRFTFIVTNMTARPEFVVDFYCGRGQMENFIKECKNDFDFSAVSSSSKAVNANRLQVHVLAYNMMNMMRRLVFPDSLKRNRMETIRIKLIKIASRVVRHGRKIIFRLCSSSPYKQEFAQIMQNILNLSFV